MKRKLYLLLSLSLYIGGAFAKEGKEPYFNGTLIYKESRNEADQNRNQNYQAFHKAFQEFSIYQFNTLQIEQYLTEVNKQETGALTPLHLVLADKSWPLTIQLYDIRSANYTYQEHTSNGIIIHPGTPAFTYRGYNGNNSSDRVVLTIRENFISGFVMENGEYFYLEPAVNFEPTAARDHFVLYRLQDALSPEALSCTQKGEITSDINVSSDRNEQAVTKCTEMAVAFDQSFKTLMGSKANAEAQITSRLNLVSDHYETEFNIEYKLVTIYECSANQFIGDNVVESCQEGGGTCATGTVLRAFRDWGNTSAGFGGVPKDVATFWTNRNLCDGSNCGNIGYSFFAGICNDKGYNIVEDFYSTGVNAHASIWIHELGHTWNATHVANNSTNMMSPTIYGNNGSAPTNRFVDSGTRTKIETHRDSRTCLTDGCSITTGLPVATRQEDIRIYPNPASTIVGIYGKDLLSVEVYNITGQLLQTIVNITQKDYVQMDIAAYSNGIYLLKLITNNHFQINKLIIQH